ncbi:hypothetical protein AB1046_23735 [Promicromonospora sp. Populi]|uniref:hypothetical protein n=1 Tax=Promicromonospora sp. Populi TaxID=3239420 RepID=UPI0034E2D14E
MTGFWAWFHDGWEIIGSLGSAAAAVIAVLLATHARDDRKIAEAERDEARRAQRSAEQAEVRRDHERQARQVAVWIDTDEPIVWESCAEGASEIPDSFLNITNYSGHPIFTVGPGETLRPEDGGPSSIGPMSPILPPGESLRFNLGKVFAGGEDPTVPLWFYRDLAGATWTRDHTGALCSLPVDAPSSDGSPDPLP